MNLLDVHNPVFNDTSSQQGHRLFRLAVRHDRLRIRQIDDAVVVRMHLDRHQPRPENFRINFRHPRQIALKQSPVPNNPEFSRITLRNENVPIVPKSHIERIRQPDRHRRNQHLINLESLHRKRPRRRNLPIKRRTLTQPNPGHAQSKRQNQNSGRQPSTPHRSHSCLSESKA